MTMSKVEDDVGRDKYEPIKRLAMVQIQPPRNPSKPFTSFCIRDILGGSNPNNKRRHDEGQGFLPPSSNKTKHANSDDVIVKRLCDESSDKLSAAVGGRRTDELLYLNKMEHYKDSFRSALSISPPLISPIGLLHKGMVGSVASPLHLQHRDFLHSHPHHHLNPRPQNKPVNLTTTSTRIVRPWDTHRTPSTSPSTKTTSPITTSMTTTTTRRRRRTTSEDCGSSDEEDEDEEISVDDDDTAESSTGGRLSSGSRESVTTATATSGSKSGTGSSKSVSPLDALMAMTSKTFAGLDNGGGAGELIACLFVGWLVSLILSPSFPFAVGTGLLSLDNLKDHNNI